MTNEGFQFHLVRLRQIRNQECWQWERRTNCKVKNQNIASKTLSDWRPIRGRMGCVVATNQVRQSTDWRELILMSVRPKVDLGNTAVPGNFLLDAVANMIQSLG